MENSRRGATVSVCMIVKNEEKVLDRALSGLSFADEIVIADTGSEDGTKKIAARYTDKIYDFQWTDDFAAARNFVFSKGSSDYLMWLDADDVVTAENAEKLSEWKAEACADTLYCLYDAAFDESGKPSFSYYRERAVRNCPLARWNGFVHECIAPFGKIERSDIRIEHRPLPGKQKKGRNLEIYRKQLQRGKEFNARERFYYGRELIFNGFKEEGIAIIKSMLTMPDAFYVNCIEGLRTIAETEISRGRRAEAKQAYLQSFLFGEPRAGALNGLGKLAMANGNYREAEFWFEAALNCRDHTDEGDFERPEERGLIPYLELTVCRWRLNDTSGAEKAHLAAAAIAPEHPSVQYNKRFFDGLRH